MEHNDPTERDLPIDPDATEVVEMDLEALLHAELDAQKAQKDRTAATTVPMMKAATRASGRHSTRLSARFPTSKPSLPPAPIYTLPPVRGEASRDEYADEPPTNVMDRARASVPSVKFPSPSFIAPRRPQPFATIPSMPAAKRASAVESQGVTPLTLQPTSRRALKLPTPRKAPNALESYPPLAMPTYLSVPPPAPPQRGQTFALVLSLAFAIASVALMGIAMAKPALIERGKIAVSAMTHRPAAKTAATTVSATQPAAPTAFSVPPVLIDDERELADNEAILVVPESAKGHRVFVDGKAIGDGDKPLITECGKHKVQVGSSGTAKALDLPCGGGLRVE